MSTLGDRLDELATYLKSPSSRGQLAMLVYPPPIERRVAVQLPDFCERLEQMGLHVRTVNVNHEVNAILGSRLEDVIEAWSDQREEARRAIGSMAGPAIIATTLSADEQRADVVIWHRVGGAYPFLSIASLMEQIIGKIDATLAIFYPGSLEGKTRLRLLDERDGYQYRTDFLRTVDE